MDSNIYNKTKKLPFYEYPKGRKSSADIINDAKSTLRMVETKRPFTPHDFSRSLYSKPERPAVKRPASNISLHSFNYDSSESKPNSRISTPRGRKNERPVSTDLNLEPLVSQIVIARAPTKRNVSSATSIRKGPMPADWSIAPGLGLAQNQENKGPFRVNKLSKFSSPYEEKVRSHSSLTNVSTSSSENITIEKKRKLFASSANVHLKSPVPINLLEPKINHHKSFLSLTQTLEFEIKNGNNKKRGLEVITAIYDQMEEIGWKSIPERCALLKVLYRWIDPSSPAFCLQIGRLILGLKVSGGNLTSLCKLIYKFSKDSHMDKIFISDPKFLNHYIHALHSTNVTEECLLYAAASFKFLSSNSLLLPMLSNMSCIQLMTFHLHRLLKSDKVSPDTSNVLNQILGTLRNLAQLESNTLSFVTTLADLTLILKNWAQEKDNVYCAIRLLSKLSVDSQLCLVLSSQPIYTASLLSTLARYKNEEEIVVRICFIIGNLLAEDQNLSPLVYQAHPLLALIIHHFLQKCSNFASGDQALEDEDIVSDVMAKIVRVIANMSVNDVVGKQIGKNEELVCLILNITDKCCQPELHEAVYGSLITLNNISFYMSDQQESTLSLDIATRITPLLTNGNLHYYIETGHVLENLACSPAVRALLIQKQVHINLFRILEANNQVMSSVACRLLGNLFLDPTTRSMAIRDGIIHKIFDVFKKGVNWSLAGLLCQVLWNLSCGEDNPFNSNEGKRIKQHLESLLSQKITSKDEYKEWEIHFCPYGKDLYNRLSEKT